MKVCIVLLFLGLIVSTIHSVIDSIIEDLVGDNQELKVKSAKICFALYIAFAFVAILAL
jgi:hypothetical protein